MKQQTYREQFVQNLDERLNSQLMALGIRSGSMDMRRYLEMVEGWNKTRFSKKSALSLYAKLQAEICRSLPNTDACAGLVAEAITASRKMAMGKGPADGGGVKEARIMGEEFIRLVRSVKDIVSKYPSVRHGRRTSTYIQLFFAEDKVTAYACDGYRIIRHTEPSFSEQGFSVAIDIPKLMPGKLEMATVRLEDGEASLSFGNVTFRTKQPKDDSLDMKELYEEVDWTTKPASEQIKELPTEDGEAWVNPAYLKEIARCLPAGNIKKEYVHIQIASGVAPVKLTCGSTEALLLQVRHKGGK